MNNWISVKDKLPEYDIKVLVFGEQISLTPQMGGAYISITNRINTKSKYSDENDFKGMRYTTY